jgi:heterotetrameric sarcosine oxidase gamma subunit
MADLREAPLVAGAALSVHDMAGLHIAALRFFDAAGAFAGNVRTVLGLPLPAPLRAARRDPAGQEAAFILAWRSPTEVLLLSDGLDLAALAPRLTTADGCLVDQSGGVRVLRVQGARLTDLLVRLGADSVIPQVGEARSGRMAEVHVLAVCVQSGEVLLLVDRAYADHLVAWIRATAADM